MPRPNSARPVLPRGIGWNPVSYNENENIRSSVTNTGSFSPISQGDFAAGSERQIRIELEAEIRRLRQELERKRRQEPFDPLKADAAPRTVYMGMALCLVGILFALAVLFHRG